MSCSDSADQMHKPVKTFEENWLWSALKHAPREWWQLVLSLTPSDNHPGYLAKGNSLRLNGVIHLKYPISNALKTAQLSLYTLEKKEMSPIPAWKFGITRNLFFFFLNDHLNVFSKISLFLISLNKIHSEIEVKWGKPFWQLGDTNTKSCCSLPSC